jgi:hypothetical protein|tara:strand:- start:370 stop:777 length:408 start_codon:yes stop_codon:yes gene_type:complete
MAEEDSLDIEAILSQTSDKDDYVESPRCLRLHRIRDVKVLDERHVAFQTGRNQFYLVQMQRRCPGLTRDTTIAYSTGSGRVCQLDSLYAVIRFGPMTERMGPPCLIPGFQEITREQLTAIRDSLRKVPRQPDETG